MRGEIKDFNTYHKNIRVKIEGLNEDIARVFLVDANDDQIVITENIVFINATTKKEISAVDVKGKKSYLITWIHSYELSVGFVWIGGLFGIEVTRFFCVFALLLCNSDTYFLFRTIKQGSM